VLNGRRFLHDYRTELDPTLGVLELIMTAPKPALWQRQQGAAQRGRQAPGCVQGQRWRPCIGGKSRHAPRTALHGQTPQTARFFGDSFALVGGPVALKCPVMDEIFLTVEHQVMQHLQQRATSLGVSLGLNSGSPTRVFDDGLLDSLGLIDLIASVEQAAGAEVDMLLFDPAQIDTADQLVAQLCAALRR